MHFSFLNPITSDSFVNSNHFLQCYLFTLFSATIPDVSSCSFQCEGHFGKKNKKKNLFISQLLWIMMQCLGPFYSQLHFKNWLWWIFFLLLSTLSFYFLFLFQLALNITNESGFFAINFLVINLNNFQRIEWAINFSSYFSSLVSHSSHAVKVILPFWTAKKNDFNF